MGNFTCDFSHVTFHKNTCETHIDSTCVSHVKKSHVKHMGYEIHVFLELHMWESHVSHMRNFCKGNFSLAASSELVSNLQTPTAHLLAYMCVGLQVCGRSLEVRD